MSLEIDFLGNMVFLFNKGMIVSIMIKFEKSLGFQDFLYGCIQLFFYIEEI